jgi:hypothetical protein
MALKTIILHRTTSKFVSKPSESTPSKSTPPIKHLLLPPNHKPAPLGINLPPFPPQRRPNHLPHPRHPAGTMSPDARDDGQRLRPRALLPPRALPPAAAAEPFPPSHRARQRDAYPIVRQHAVQVDGAGAALQRHQRVARVTLRLPRPPQLLGRAGRVEGAHAAEGGVAAAPRKGRRRLRGGVRVRREGGARLVGGGGEGAPRVSGR